MRCRQGLTAQVKRAAECRPASDALSLNPRIVEKDLGFELVGARLIHHVLQSLSILRVQSLKVCGRLDQSQQT